MATENPNILFQVIDSSDASVQGELDIYEASNFPLALTFSIKDVMDMTSSKGSFSKSFQIPATSNNNKILKFLISDSFYNSFEYIEGKKARIFVDGILVLEGGFQIKGHAIDEIPDYYECVVFGDNYKWVNALDKLNLCDIDFDAGGFYADTPNIIQYSRDNVMATWDYNNSGQLIGGDGTHVVYPLINTGKWIYGNQVHFEEMAPAIWIYDMVKVILAKQGYTLDSDFMETEWFHKLISATPAQSWENDESMLEQYAFEYEQESTETGWKIPWDLRGTGHASNFKGCWHELQVVTPTSDPSNLITQLGFTTQPIDVNLLLGNSPPASYFGWYWGSGTGSNYPLANGDQLGVFNLPVCGWSWVGSDWSCIPDWTTAPPPQPTTSHAEDFPDGAKFNTNFLGEYEFNGACQVEMYNDAVILGTNETLDPMFNVASHESGFIYYSYAYGCGWNIVVGGGYEGESVGFRYKAVQYVMHYKDSTGRVEPIVADCKYLNSSGGTNSNIWGYCNGNLPTSAVGNIFADLSFNGVTIEILSDKDYVYYYTEVYEEMNYEWWEEFGGGSGIRSRCQCQYRLKRMEMNGGLTPTIVDGGSVSVSNLLPCDVTQLEWLNGLTGLFNLYWSANEITKTIKVEPRDNFVEGAATAIDWSDKLDWGRKQSSKYIYDSLKRNLCFSYMNDGSDGFVEERNRRKAQICELGSEVLDLGELFVNEDQIIGSNYYAPTYMFRDRVIATNTSKAPFIPVIHSEYSTIWSTYSNADYPDKIDEHIARILLWGGKTPLNLNDGFTNANTWRFAQTNPSNAADELNYYPFAGVYCDEDETYFGDLTVGTIAYYPQLYFQDVLANMAQPTPATFATCEGLYRVFWERNIENLITRPKIKTAWFHLTAQDISDLEFQKLIYIENSEAPTYYIINKIVDYKPASNQMTKVELFEWSLAKPRKQLHSRLGQEYGPSYDSGIGQVGSNKVRLMRNFASELGIVNVGKLEISKQSNLTLNNPLTPTNYNVEQSQADNPNNSKWSYVDTTGQITTNPLTSKSFNIGNENNIKNRNGVVIGNNNIIQNNPNGIIIGNNANSWKRNGSPIEFHVGTQSPALVIDPNGNVLAGGGGEVLLERCSDDGRTYCLNAVYLEETDPFTLLVTYRKVLLSN